jgi:NAD(P)-dependent dehydrogenase (short-subunit alcohol dehydrogenase family)
VRPELRLSDTKALVTGGGRGIGKGLALALGRAGADVALTFNQSERGAREVVDELSRLGRRAVAIPADLSRVADAQHAVAATVEALGRIDLLVYNAGITDPHPFLEMDEAEYDATLDINLKGAFFCIQAAARAMIERGGGRVVAIGSLHGSLSFPGHAHYAASKAGLEQLVRTVANELAPYGITANLVVPGMVEVEKTRDGPEPYDRAVWGTTIPLGRVGTPDDIAGAVMFLASPEASYVTAAVIRVDGGIMTRSPHYPPSGATTYPNLRRPGR